MNLRHHRKRVQRAMKFRGMVPVKHPVLGRTRYMPDMIVSWPRHAGRTWATEQARARSPANDLLDAIAYGFSAFPYQQEFVQSLELSPAEKTARQIVQDAEMFDRTLDHYVRPGGLEAIPAQHHMGTSMRYYEQRMREACRQYGTELRTLARRYSQSREYEQWLRENPPEARR